MSRRNAVTAANRRRQRAKEWAMFNSNGRHVGRALDHSLEQITLQAVDRSGHCCLARFEKRRFSGWKLLRADPELDFLRYCRLTDCPSALRNRHFEFQWVKSCRPEVTAGAL